MRLPIKNIMKVTWRNLVTRTWEGIDKIDTNDVIDIKLENMDVRRYKKQEK